MRYLYTLFKKSHGIHSPQRLDTATRLSSIKDSDVTSPFFVEVFDMVKNKESCILNSVDDLDGFRDSLEKAAAWSNKQTSPLKVNDFDPFTAIIKQEESIVTQDIELAKIKTAVSPKHYQGYMEAEELQWLDAMSRIPTLRDPAKFKAAVELQIRKYLDRNGGKDKELQELMKAKWYLNYLIAYIKNGEKPIKAVDVDAILSK